MIYDTTAIESIINKYPTHKDFCKAAGITQTALCKALKRGKFTTDQIHAILNNLNVADEDIRSYFFTSKGAKREQI